MAALAATICLASAPVLADGGSGGDDGGDLAAAREAVAQAQIEARQAQDQVTAASIQLADARAALAQAQAQLAAIESRITSLNAEVASDQAEVTRLAAEIQHDKRQLAAFLRASYESGGSETTVEYLVDARNISDLVARIGEVEHVASAGNVLVDRINAEEGQEQHLLAATVAARSQAQAAEQQEATQEVIIANDEASDAQVLAADQALAAQADSADSTAQNQYDLISEYENEYSDAAAALAEAQADDTVFAPIAGPLFTEDTDLTVASGENAQTINGFLAGTALAGLGDAYMQAEKTYGVSARYLVAHSIEEFGLGRQRDRPAGEQPLRLRRGRQQPRRRRHELRELQRLHPLRGPAGAGRLPDPRWPVLPRPHAAGDERRLRVGSLLGVEDRLHRPDRPAAQLLAPVGAADPGRGGRAAAGSTVRPGHLSST